MHSTPSEALVTKDGVITGMGNHPDSHREYRTGAYGLRVQIPLSREEQFLAQRVLKNRGMGMLRLVVRSCIAQLGVDAFHPDVTDVRIQSGHMVVETLVANYSTDPGNHIMDALRAVSNHGRAKFARAAILPESATLSAQRIDDALVARTIRAPGAVVVETKGVDVLALPLRHDFHYAFQYDQLPHDRLIRMIMGNGRDVLRSARPPRDGLPEVLRPHGFFVGAIDIDYTKYHLVLEPETIRNGVSSPLVHGQSCVLDSERTGTEGPVQVELRNINGTPETLSNLSMCARVYVAKEMWVDRSAFA